MSADPTWDFRHPASKRRVLGALDREAAAMFELVDDPQRWHAPTACTGWEVRDMIGHLVDATEGYLRALATARKDGATGAAARPVEDVAAGHDRAAKAFRAVPRDELMERFRATTDSLLEAFAGLSDEDWTDLLVPEPDMGPLPAMFVVEGLLGGYTVHGWDVRSGLGLQQPLSADSADLLVPFVPLLWWATAVTTSVEEPFTVGVRTTGRNGGDVRFDVSRAGLSFEVGDASDCDALLEVDPGTLVLTAYDRVHAGTVTGDAALARRFRSLFVSL